MNWKTIGLVLLLADFSALTAWAVWEHGYVGIFALALANTATMLLAVDLVIALGMIGVWLWSDARERGINPAPWVALTATFGSAGPLLYLLLRGRLATPAARGVRAMPA